MPESRRKQARKLTNVAVQVVIGFQRIDQAGLTAQTKWDLPAAYPATNFHTENLQQFANDVDKATGGKLKITVHANASLFKAPEIKRAVQGGRRRSARSCWPTSRTSGRSTAPTACPSWPTATTNRQAVQGAKAAAWRRSWPSRA
jgi:TRAP-type C4-dicarboxylate transport system substrate-binding protein